MDFTTILGIAIIIVVVVALYRTEKRDKVFGEARIAYQDALERLKANPTNADLRQHVLQLGRYYSNLTRDKRGVTVYDEVALMNDINAATASATSVSNNSSPKIDSQLSIEDRLKRLEELRQKGLVTEQEYLEGRNKLLDLL